MYSKNLVRVCSHPRSGTHMLLAILYKNFEFNQDISLVLSPRGMKWVDGRTKQVLVPWGKLHGTHKKFGVSKTDPKKRLIYLIRHPVDVMSSFWRFANNDLSTEEYIKKSRIQFWYDSVKSYEGHAIFVRYEDLINDKQFVPELEKIRAAYKLKPKSGYPIKINEMVGWIPLNPKSTTYNREYVTDLVKKVVPQGFFGYYF